MNELLDGEKEKSPDTRDGAAEKEGSKRVESGGSNLNENASRPIKMVESASRGSSSSGEMKPEKKQPPDKFANEKKYDSRDRPPYRGGNGIRPSPGGRGRRDDDRRTSPSKSFRKQESKPPTNSSSNSYRRDSESKRPEPNKPFSDESRLSKLIRRVQRETERDRRMSAAKQLTEYLNTPEGGKWAVRTGDDMLATLKEIFFERGYKDTKNEIAVCIGLIGSQMGSDAQRYFQWLFGQINSMIEDDIRILFLQALQETIKRHIHADLTVMVLNQLQTLLENADTPDLLMVVVNIIMQLTKIYPNIFSDYFRDTVDILVGWHIDSTQRDGVIKFTSEALISFRQFWVSDQSFTKELLGQFLEDMEAYAEDLGVVAAGQASKWSYQPDEMVKMGSLLKVFTTVIKSLGEDFDPRTSQQLYLEYFLDVFDKTVQSVDSAVKMYFSESLIMTGNRFLCLMLVMLGRDIVQCQESLLAFVTTIMFPGCQVSSKYIISALNLTKKVVELFGNQLPVLTVSQVLAPGSLIHTSKLSSSPEVLKELTTLYQTMLALKNIPLLEETYRFLLADIQLGYNTLLESSGDERYLELLPGDTSPLAGVTYGRRQAEASCIFSLYVLGELANTKTSLIGMMALSPSIFDLYSKHLDVTRPSMSLQYPALQFAILQSLYAHGTRHGNFISTSALLTQNTPLEGSVLAAVNPTTSQNFSRLLKLLADLLVQPNTQYDSKLLSLKWVSEMVTSLHTSQHVFVTRQFLTLVQAVFHVGYDQERELAVAAHTCLTALFKNPRAFPSFIIKGCVKLCTFQLSRGAGSLCDLYFSLLAQLPINVTASKNNGLYLLEEETQLVYSEATTGLTAMWTACRAHTAKVPLGSFHSHNFRQVIRFLLHNGTVKQTGSLPWLEATYYSAQRPNSKDTRSAEGMTMQNYLSGNVTVQWFWALWEAAQFCILARLRTPLGKPQETFTSIEAVLKGFSAEISDSHGDEGEDRKRGSEEQSEADQKQLRVKLMLQFMEQLEKQLYNAYEGAAVSMALLPKTVRTFFRTNKNTCQEWLSRIRIYVIKVALHSGHYSIVVRHASELLHEMKAADNTQGAEFETVVQYLVQALCKLGEADAVQGVYSWCKDILGRKMVWIKAAVEKAYGRYEMAAKEYKSALRQLLNMEEDKEREREDSVGRGEGDSSRGGSTPLKITGIMTKDSAGDQQAGSTTGPAPVPSGKVNMFVNEIQDCYVSLNDWEAVLEWQETYCSMRTDSQLTLPQPAYGVDMCFIKYKTGHRIIMNDWEAVLEWQETYCSMRTDSQLTLPQPAYGVDMCFIKALAAFDGCEEAGAVRKQLELIPCLPQLGEWGLRERGVYAQAQFIHAANLIYEHTAVNNHKSEIVRLLRACEGACEGVLKVQSMDWPLLVSQETVSLLTVATGLRTQVEDKKGKTVLLPVSEKLSLDESDHSLYTFQQAIRLVRLQQSFSNDRKKELSEQLLQLQLGTASLARKQHNYRTAERVLLSQARLLVEDQASSDVTATPAQLTSLRTAIKTLQADTASTLRKLDLIRRERETAKLTHSTGDQKEAIELLVGSVVGYSLAEKERTAGCDELCSRSLLTLVKWLQSDHKLLSSLASKVSQGDSGSALAQKLHILLDQELRAAEQSQGLVVVGDSSDLKIGDHPILSDTEPVVGRLLHLSTIQCETLPKAWYTLAGWCYKWGRKAVDNASHGSVQLFTDEKAQILSLLPKEMGHDEKESVLSILSQIHSVMTSEEDISDQDQSQYDDGTETTRRQLLANCPSLQSVSDSCLEALLDVWKGVVHRIYHYYNLSATAYFKFLKLNGCDKLLERPSEDCNVIGTLRLLRLLVKHAWELRTVLETGLAATPTAPWKGIIPQLFSRLSHPEAYVRQSISELLCRVAEDAPHLIVYPAVVGSSTTTLDTKSETGLLNNYLSEAPVEGEGSLEPAEDPASQDEDDLTATLEADSMLHNCIMSMLNTLATNFPQMISDVKQLIEELRRITLLWDELWLGTLNQQHADVERRVAQLEAEIKKVTGNQALSKEERTAIIREKHKTVLKPTVYTMERLQEITSQPTQTPHERWFQDTYGGLIASALHKLKFPSNPNHPRASWHPFKQIHVSLQQRAQKRSSLVLLMDEISPKLHSLRNTVIAMPGLGSAGQLVTIESVSNTVQILPTKTKPKKLVFKGSDGKRYPYLFKGLEDLHLDERIMQFLNIVNNMFACDNKGSHELYRARHYSVTPLGPRSGLIQWVDGVTPLFALYKRWQQREALAQMLKQQAASGTATQPSIPRPSEVYYNKLTPLLRELGIKDLDNRKDWPLSVQQQVLEDLMVDTPRDLLARELWCASLGPNEWWYITQTYARSTAVMSMIGYIIGLGDRHLDNVLVDLNTGEVVHIDYNVCFEKGKGLRVPEKVPFRLTQNIEAALGITGVEGTFRLASEHVMKTMRKGRETLLTLLEAFVYDPLVDWTTGNEGGYAGAFYGGGLATGTGALEGRQGKLDMEREITQSMFSIRVAEMKAAWTQNRLELVGSLPRVQDHLDTRSNKVVEYAECMLAEERLQELKQAVIEAQANPTSPVFSLHDRYKEYLVIKTSQDAVNKMVEERINECLNWQQMHKHVMSKIQGSAFQKMCADIASSLNLGTPSFATAKDFLQGAGQGSIIQQCEQVETELTASLQLQRGNLHRVIEVLHTYGTIVAQFGASFADNTRTSNYLQWLQELVSDFTESRCEEVVHHCHDLYGDSTVPQSRIQLVISTDAKLQNLIQEANNRLLKLLERRSLEKLEVGLLDLQVQESRAAIDSFVKENGESGMSSLTAVIVTVLCDRNKRNLQMEAAAAGAGDRLQDLTSIDGDWFLDELCSMSGNVSQFVDMIKACQQIDDGVQFGVLHKGLMATHYVYIALQDLNSNFRTIILPEALKLIQSQDPTVFGVLSQLEKILTESGKPLDTLISQLEVLHRNAVMGMKADNAEVTDAIADIQLKFRQLLEGCGGADLSPGQMLLMGFNGLFTRVDDDFLKLLECVDGMAGVPEVWKKVDVIKEAKSLQLSSFTENTRGLLLSLFFVRRLQVMQEFFHMCTQFAAAIQGLDGGNCYDEEQLSRPIKRFIADYVRKQVLGFHSRILGYILCTTLTSMGLDVTAEIELKDVGAESKAPLEDLSKKAIELCLRSGHFQQVHRSQASALASGQDTIWKRHDLTRRLDCNIELLKGSLQRAQLHITRLHWLHEDLFIQGGRPPNQFVVANRATVMSEIKKCMQALVSQETNLVQCQAPYAALEASITQRLKWAAGANPSLNLILQQFEEASLIRKQLAEEESKHSQEVINLCQGILHLEALRTRTPEAMSSDTQFLALVNKCNEACMLTSSSSCSVTETEVLLMQTKPLEEGQRTDTAWLKQCLKEINVQLKDTDRKLLALKDNIDDAKDGIKSEVSGIKTLLTTHHKLMSDIRAVLKSLAKQEEAELGETVNGGGVRDYLGLYKKFSENMTLGLKMMMVDDPTSDSLAETRSLLETLTKQIPEIYEDLVQLAPPLISVNEDPDHASPHSFSTAVKKPSGEEDSHLRRASVLGKEHLAETPPTTGSPQTSNTAPRPSISTPVKKPDKVTRDPKTGKAIQERNSYAVGVWRRVKMKLDGRDPDLNKRLSVPEQVDYVIKDATSLDNLAVLYEGWTPWV